MDGVPTVEEQIAELEREEKLRLAVYPRWVTAKKLTQRAADLQLARLREAIKTLRMLR